MKNEMTYKSSSFYMRLTVFLVSLLLMAAFSQLAFADCPDFSGGDGSSGTPYQISVLADLIALSDASGDDGGG